MKRKKRWRGGDWREGWRGLWEFKERKGRGEREGGRNLQLLRRRRRRRKRIISSPHVGVRGNAHDGVCSMMLPFFVSKPSTQLNSTQLCSAQEIFFKHPHFFVYVINITVPYLVLHYAWQLYGNEIVFLKTCSDFGIEILPGQNKTSDKYERIRGGNGDFNSAQTCFHSLFWTFYSVLEIRGKNSTAPSRIKNQMRFY